VEPPDAGPPARARGPGVRPRVDVAGAVVIHSFN
jgi:hypothetical protein